MSANQIISAPLGEIKAATVDGTSAAYTTAGHLLTAAATGVKLVQLPIGARYAQLIPRNFSTAVAVRYALNPYLAVVKTSDAFATSANVSHGSETCQDADNSTKFVVGMNTGANAGYFYLGAHVPFRGVCVNVGTTNSAAATMSVAYWSGATWSSVSGLTDGTLNTGNTFGQDGNVTWTVPTDWTPAALRSVATPVVPASVNIPHSSALLYWIRITVNANLTAAADVLNILALSRNSSAYAEMTSTDSVDFTFERGIGGLGCIEACTDAGTANLIVNVATGMSSGSIFKS